MPGNVDTITNNLNEIISTKNEFKQIIQENGMTAGTVFSEYPSQIRSLIGSGGGSGYIDYLNTYQFAYVSGISGTAPGCAVNLAGDGSLIFQGSYVRANIFSYPLSSDFTGHEFVSMGTLKNYVNSYASTYITSTTIDESIIPNTNNTYTLGDNSHIYSNTYSRSINLGTGARIFSEASASSNDIAIALNGVSYYYINPTRFAPNGSANNETIDLGAADRKWNGIYAKTLNVTSAYTSNIYSGNIYLNDNNALYNKTQYQVNLKLNGSDKYVFRTNHLSPASNGGSDLGQSDLYWNNAYINNAYISNYNNLIWTGNSAQYAALPDYTTYQIYLIQEA